MRWSHAWFVRYFYPSPEKLFNLWKEQRLNICWIYLIRERERALFISFKAIFRTKLSLKKRAQGAPRRRKAQGAYLCALERVRRSPFQRRAPLGLFQGFFSEARGAGFPGFLDLNGFVWEKRKKKMQITLTTLRLLQIEPSLLLRLLRP